jgi:hypothetical protein
VKRAIVLALSVILALTMAAPTVLAQEEGPPNGGAPEDVSDTFTVNPGDIPGTCSFPMLFELSGKGKTITLPDGTLIITSPGLDVTVTNLDNPENQATFNITGSFHQTTNPETSQETTVVTGRNFLFDPVAGTVIAIGNFSFVFNADGTLAQPLEGDGQLIDVCALLE